MPCAEPQTERAAAGGRQRQEGGQEVSADVSQARDAETEASGGRRRGRGRRGRAREDRRRDRAAGGAPAAAAAPRPRARAAAAGEQLPGPAVEWASVDLDTVRRLLGGVMQTPAPH